MTHYLIDAVGCIQTGNNDAVEQMLSKMVEYCGCRELQRVHHAFEPFGYTAVVLLAESHLSCHTWPENERDCIHLFTFGKARVDVDVLKWIVSEHLGGSSSVQVIQRGRSMVTLWPRRQWRNKRRTKE